MTAASVPAVLEVLSDEECELYAILSDESGLDIAEFAWFDPDAENGCFRAWAFQWVWYRSNAPLQIDQCARSVGKSLSIKVRAFAFPFLFPGQEMVVTAPELVHLEPIVSLIEAQVVATRLTRELLMVGRSAVTHRPFQMNFVNGARIIGRIPQRDGRGVKGCVGEGTMILTERGHVPVEELKVGELVLTHSGQWKPVLDVQTDVNDCYEVTGQSSFPMIASCDHRFYGVENLAGPKEKRAFTALGFYDVEFLQEFQVYWATPTQFDPLPIPPLPIRGTAREILPTSDAFWWLVGRYLADGYLSSNRTTGKERRVIWVVPEHKRRELCDALEAIGTPFRIVQRRHSSADTVAVNSSALFQWLEANFGRLAHGKRIPGFAFGMEEKHRRALLDGYLAGDGYYARDRWEVSSASRALANGVKLLAQSVGYTVNCSVVQPKTTEINGTKLKKSPLLSYRLQIGHGIPAEVKDHLVAKVKSVVPVGKRRIYNPIVADDHSYVSESIVSHNIHPVWLELDEAQDYPHAGWIELTETLKRGHEGAVWRAHGVTRGLRDDFYEHTQDSPDNEWKIHRFAAMWRPNWSDQERTEKIKQYGSRDDPDYRRNVLGLHGDATNPMFVLSRLMKCVDDDDHSEYNEDEYFSSTIKAETLLLFKQKIEEVMDFPPRHRNYLPKGTYWSGMDVGYTTDPSEIVTFVEYRDRGDERSKLRLLSRVSMQRMSHGDQVRAILHTIDYYRPKVFAMDKTGLGLPLFKDIQERAEDGRAPKNVIDIIKGYNFSEKITVGFDDSIEVDEFKGDAERDAGIRRSVLEFASDTLRTLVDEARLVLPWDADLLKQFQGSTWTSARGGMDQYGRRIFSKGNDHILDASRMAVLGWAQYAIEEVLKKPTNDEPVFDVFLV